MNSELIDKLYELVDLINDNPKLNRLKELKEIIYNDKELKSQLDYCHNNDDKYSQELIDTRKKVIDNPIIREYRELENEMYYTILEINKNLNGLTLKKGCKDESN